MTIERPREKVLIVDDEPSVLSLLEFGLRKLDSELFLTSDSESALRLVQELDPDLVILDILLPDVDGYEVCRRIRQFSTAPVILVTALREGFDHAQALDAGADEHISKPFSIADLRRRVRLALDRSGRNLRGAEVPETTTDGLLPFGGGAFGIDRCHHLVYQMPRRRKQMPSVVPVSNCGFRLLAYLGENANRRVTYHELLEQVWGPEWTGQRDLVRAHLANLRRKIEADPLKPRLLADDGESAVRLES